MDATSADRQLFDDTLSNELVLPLGLEPLRPASLAGSEMRLRAIALVEDGRSDDSEERSELSATVHRLEAKLDLLLGLSASLAALHRPPLPPANVRLSARGLRVELPASATLPSPLAAVTIQAADWLPDPVLLPARLLATATGDGSQYLWLAFDNLSDGLQTELERYVFRLHRRQIASSRRQR